MAALIATGQYPYLERIVVDAEDFPDPDVQSERRLATCWTGCRRTAADMTGRPEPWPRASPIEN